MSNSRAWADGFMQDIRWGLRSMRRYPVATLVGVLSLAAGIGATTATLTVRNAVFRNPPPLYQQPDQLSRVRLGRIDRPARLSGRVPAELVRQWQASLGGRVGALSPGTPTDVRAGERIETATVSGVTPGLFALLGVNAALGSTTTFDRAALEGTAAVVLSDGAWKRLFDGRSDVVGQTVWIDNDPHLIAAVMPQRFWVMEMGSPIWRAIDVSALGPEDALDVIVRRPAGTSNERLDAELQPHTVAYAATLRPDSRQIRQRVFGIEGTPIGDQVSLALPYVLGVAVLLTLVIACANAAILMIAQWTAREHEIALRASIGAGRARLVRTLLTESTIIAGSAGVLGIAAAFIARGVIVARSSEAQFFDLSIRPELLAQVAAITLGAGVLVGFVPALHETRRLQANPLRSMAAADRVRQRWRHALVVLEVAVTVALLVVTTSMVDGYRRALSADTGFAVRGLIGASVRHRDGVNIDATLQRLQRLPGIASAAAATTVPYAAIGPEVRIASDSAGSNSFNARQNGVTAAFFSTLGVPILAGRSFDAGDTSATRTVIVNEALARRTFAVTQAAGREIHVGGVRYEIIGVSGDFASNLSGRRYAQPEIFLPIDRAAAAPTAINFIARAEGDAGSAVEPVRRLLRAGVPGTDVRRVYALTSIRDIGAQEILVGAAPLVPLITLGILLTTAGIYGVLAFAIARRARELAVRLAIGASARDLVRLVTHHTARLVTTGTAIGIVVTYGLARVVRAGGGAGSVFDPAPVSFIVPVLMLVAVGFVASWAPSRRAMKINPATVLRTT